MSSKRTIIAAMGIAAGLGVGSAQALTLTYEFTAADLFNQVFVDGADGSSAADNDLFDGARLLRVGTNGGHAEAGRTYVESQHDNFTSRWNQYTEEGYVFDYFNLWGLDGRGAFWGEDFKPLQWVDATAPDGWVTGKHTWPASWGTPPAGYLTDEFPYFWSPDPANAFNLDADISFLASQKFSVTIEFDTTDAFWGQDIQDAPASLGAGEEIVFWFGGYVTKFDGQGEMDDWHLYEGNMTLTASAPIPEPVTGLLALIGMGGLGVAGLRRRR